MSDNQSITATPAVVTDLSDYPPGSTANITASGFDTGSTVQFAVQIINADGSLSPAVTWLSSDGGSGDGDATANGTVQTSFYVDQMYANTTIQLTATEVQVGDDGTISPVGPSATEVFTDAASTPAITVTKSVVSVIDVNHDGLTDAGDIINYDVNVKNTSDGPVTLTNVVVTDPLLGGTIGTYASLAPGASQDIFKSYTITQTDVDNHGVGLGHGTDSVLNAASATGHYVVFPSAGTVSSSSSVSTPVDYKPGMTIVKTVDSVTDTNHDGLVDAGDVINYKIVVTNTGDVDLTGVAVTDPLTGNPAGQVSSIAVGGSETLSASYTIQQGDVNGHGPVTNTAIAVTNETPSATSSVSTPVDYKPGMTIVKTVDSVTDTNHDGLVDAGDVINYKIVVTNTGDVDLTGVAVTDPLTGNPAGQVSSIAVGGSETLSASYTIQQGDVNGHGPVTNTAIAVTNETPSATSSVSTPVDYKPGMTIVKTVDSVTDTNHDGLVDAGDVINYKIVVTNTGDVDLTGVAVTDPLTGNPAGQVSSIAVGGSETLSASYTIQQGDVNGHGPVTNTAIAVTNETPSATSSVSTPVDYKPGMTIVKTVDSVTDTNHDGLVDAGDVINYKIVVTNTGDVDLTGVAVTDPLTGNPAGQVSSIAVGGSETLSASYTIQQGDVNGHGPVTNTAIAVTNETPSATSSVSTPVDYKPGMTIVKTVDSVTDTNHDGLVDAGDVINYKIVVTNTGDVDLTGVAVTDPLTGNPAGQVSSIAVGGSETLSASYAITQADVNGHGPVTNTAIAVTNETPSATSSVSTPVDYKPGMTIVKTVDSVTDTNHDGLVDAGDVINYKIVVTNTGDVDLTGVAVTDPLTGNPAGQVSSIAVGGSETLSASYAITQADVNGHGPVTNTAIAVTNETPSATSSVSTPVDYKPGMTIVKTVDSVTDTNHDGLVDAGDVINYKIVVTNTGDVDLTGVAVTDPLTGNPAGQVSSIAVGGSETLSASYAITQADVNGHGPVTNTAIAVTNETPSATSSVSTPVDYKPGMTIVKTVDSVTDTNNDGITDAGDVINYKIVVTNTGDVDLTGVAVTDPLTGNPAGQVSSIAVGGSETLSASYAITQADVNGHGPVTNTAIAVTNETPSATSSVSTPVDYKPGMTIVKTVNSVTDTNHDGLVDAGDVINYKIVVTNTGDVDLTGVAVTDPLTGNPAGQVSSIAVGGSETLSASYAITQADVNGHGSVTNTATAVTNETPSATSSVSTPVDYKPGMTIVKTVSSITDINHDGLVDAGDVINYKIVVTNTGDVTLTGVNVTDPLTGNPAGQVSSIAVGGSETLSASYAITQADVNGHGPVVNTATAVSTQTPSATASVSTPVDYKPGMTIVKTVSSITDCNHDNLVDAGDVINYKIVVTNTGDVTLTGVNVTDPLTGNPAGQVSTLAVGGSETLSASYTITSNDMSNGGNPVSSGKIVNTAIAKDNQGDNVSATATTTLNLNHALSLTKTVTCVTDTNCDGMIDAGDVISYDIKVTNSGNVALTNVQVTDPLTGAAFATLASLAVGASKDFLTSYTITSANMSLNGNPAGSGLIVNTAYATDSQGDSKSASASTAISYRPNLTLTKTVTCVTDTNKDCLTDAGDVITYDIKVKNTGDVVLTGVTINDPLTGGLIAKGVTLGIGQTLDYYTSYTVKQSDVDNVSVSSSYCGTSVSASVTNTATVTDDQGITKSASATTGLDVSSGIDVEKMISVDGGKNWYFVNSGCGDSYTVAQLSAMTGIGSSYLHIGSPTVAAGTTIMFKVMVTNTGDVTDHNIAVKDAADTADLNGANFTFGGSKTVANLAAGASIVSDALTTTAAVGCHSDTATVSGTYSNANLTLSRDSDSMSYTGTFTANTCAQTSSYWSSHHSSWDEATIGGVKGILLGDYTGTAWEGGGTASSPKAMTSVPTGMLFISDAAAVKLLSSSSSDPRASVAAQAIAAQLNIDNGVTDAGYYAPGGNPNGHDLIGEAVKWLTGQGPFTYSDGSTGNIDSNHNGILDASEYNTSTGVFAGTAQTTSKQEWTGLVDPINAAPKTGDIQVTGQDLKNALAAFNGAQLVTAMAGFDIGWEKSGTPTDIRLNTPDTFWTVLKDQGIIAGPAHA